MQLFLGWKQALYKGNTCMFNEKFRFNGLQSDISLPLKSTTSCIKKAVYYPEKKQTDIINSKQMIFKNIDNIPEIRNRL